MKKPLFLSSLVYMAITLTFVNATAMAGGRLPNNVCNRKDSHTILAIQTELLPIYGDNRDKFGQQWRIFLHTGLRCTVATGTIMLSGRTITCAAEPRRFVLSAY